MSKKSIDDVVNISKDLEKLGCKLVETLEDFESPFYISSGLFSLDTILSIKEGFGAGSIIEISGGEGVGKTSLVLSVIAELQKTHALKPYYINIERGLTKGLISCFNVDASKVQWINPNNGNAAINAIDLILKSQPKSLVILDSIPACIPSALYDEDSEHKSYSPVAGLLNNFLPKAKFYCEQNQSILILLNQLRDNIGAGPYAPKDRTPGGRAIKFYSDCRISLRKKDSLKSGDEKVGHQIKAETIKNRFHKPYQSATITLIYGKGFDVGLDVLDIALQMGVVDKSGSYYTFENEKWYGGATAAKAISSDNTLANKIRDVVRKTIA